MKYHLKRYVGERVLTFEEMSTVLVQIESCLNSRPFCTLSNDGADSGHFLTGDSLLAPPATEIEKLSLTERWRNYQFYGQQFLKLWRAEYLASLQQRPKLAQPRENLRVGEFVFDQGDRIPSNRWALGRIIKIHVGSDGLVRVATLKTQSGVIDRPIAKLYPLPVKNGLLAERC